MFYFSPNGIGPAQRRGGRQGSRRREKMKQKRCILVGVFLFLCVGMAALLPGRRADAASPSLSVIEVDYDKETVTVATHAGDTKLFYSDGKMKNWECAYGGFSAGQYVLDISWVSKSREYTLMLKGDKSETPVSVVLPKQQSNFKVKYDCLKEKLEFTNAGTGLIFWRKSDSTTWNAFGTAAALQKPTIDIFKRLYAKGATLCFRTGQIKGTASSPGLRPSKEVKLKIAKQASAPKVSVNTVKLTVSTTDKMEYQLNGAGEWKACTKDGLKLSELAAAAFSKNGSTGKDVTVSIRTAATEKKLASAVQHITVKAQETVPGNVDFNFKSCSSMIITIPEKKDADGNVTDKAASKNNPYEYTVVKEGETLKEDASWTAITSAELVLKEEKAPKGSTVYVRKKSIYSSDGIYRLCSLATSWQVPEYPEETKAVLADGETASAGLDEDGKVALVKTADSKPSGLVFRLVISKLFDTDIDKLTCGGTELEFTSEKTENVVLVTITSTEKYEAALKTRDKAYPIKITLKNGETLSNAVTLKVLGRSSVSKGAVFDVYRSTGSETEHSFVVIPGKMLDKAQDGSHLTANIVSISLLDQTVVHQAVTDSDGNWKVTIRSDNLQSFFQNEKMELDKEYPLTITMSSGETLKDSIKLRFSREAAITGAPIIFVKKVGSDLEESLGFEITCKKSGVYVSTVTWNGINIMGNCTVNSGKIFVELDYRQLNALTLTSGEKEVSYPVIVTLSDGGLIEEGLNLVLQQ